MELVRDRVKELFSVQPRVEVISLEDFLNDVDSKLNGSDQELSIPHVVIQSRQFVGGDRALKLFGQIMRSNPEKTIINVDSSAKKGFQKDFEPHLVSDSDSTQISVRYTHSKNASIPIAGQFIGRNHVRVILLGETAYLSTFDFAEKSFDRDELFLKITDPQIVQAVKIISMWDYRNKHDSWSQHIDGIDILFDSGNKVSRYLSVYAEEKLIDCIQRGSTVWIASSWHPDEIEKALMAASQRGANVKMLINRPREYESVGKIPFNITKILSELHFKNKMASSTYEVFYPISGQIHGKFILVDNSNVDCDPAIKNWWFVGTSNHTRYGSIAKTAELGLAGTDENVQKQLMKFIENNINRGVYKYTQ